MKDFRYKNYKKILFEEKLSGPLKFCPYCRVIFNSTKYYEYTNDNKYKCLSCDKEDISHDTYASQQRNGQNYKINNRNDKKEINAFILKEILKLINEGFSQEQIYEITHFSRIRIAKIVNRDKTEKGIPHSKKTFFNNYLKIDLALIEKVCKNEFLKDEEKKLLITASLKFGCSFDFIAKVFHLSKREISTYKKKLSDDDLKELIRNKKQYQIQYIDNPSSIGYNISIKNLIVK
ncbi:hypothetical protein CKA56_13820 [Arcobacter venerupis]|nr:hypothetical protein [Arcobacter venerupis]RWS48510.1 hypothetical protein CKA56_13820 [Arcobacter venerupis]